MILEKIEKCKLEYQKCFCKIYEQPGFIRFQDDLLPDMYHHNFTWVKHAKNDAGLIQLIEDEISYKKSIGKDFCLIRCNIPVSETVLAQLSHQSEVSVEGCYVLDTSKYTRLEAGQACHVAKISNAGMVEELLKLDLLHDEESLGVDFCTRRVYRRKDIYLSDSGVDSYICYNNGTPVGSCDLFIHNDTAKIEDFSISPNQQRKGFGTVLIKTLIEIALDSGVTTVFWARTKTTPQKKCTKS